MLIVRKMRIKTKEQLIQKHDIFQNELNWIILIIITHQQRVKMSFLQLISRSNNQKSINPAFYQLINHQKIPNMTSHKSQPKQITSTQAQQPFIGTRNGLKTRAVSVNQKQFISSSKTKGISYSKSQLAPAKRKNSSFQKNVRDGVFQKKCGTQTNRVQYHHSFSNYLAKKHICPNKYNMHGKLMYFNLEEIVNKIASPIKLEPKLEVDAGIVQCKQKKALNLTQYQRFLRQVHYEKNRYHKNQFDKEDQNTIKQGRYIDIIGESKQTKTQRKSLWLRKTPKKTQRRELDIMPWHQNEEQHSPMKPKNICAPFRPNPISQDFQSFIV